MEKMSPFWKSCFLASSFLTWGLVVAVKSSEEPKFLLEARFAQTTDFVLEQIEKISFDKEFLAFIPKNFKRSAILEEKKDKCMDNIGTSHCKYLKKHQACFTHTKRMALYCNKTCHFCVPKKQKCSFSKYGCCQDTITPAKGFYFSGCSEGCFDKHDTAFCKMARDYSMCTDKNKQVQLGCKKTCEICRACIDEEPAKCRAAKLYGLCHSLKFRMMNMCRKSCQLCGDLDPCGKVSCAKGRKCIVNRFGETECVCVETCDKGDHYTGVVCGRDGIDYANLCKLKMSSCNGKAKKVKWYGKCHPDVSYLKNVNCSKPDSMSLCKQWKRVGACRSWRNRMALYCPHTCGMCVAKTHRPACYYSKHGCCLDDSTPCQGPNCENCNFSKPCENRYRRLCNRFVSSCGERRNKQFMKHNCPSSCYYCPKRR